MRASSRIGSSFLLLVSFVLEMLLKPVEAFVPETLVLRNPCCDFSERFTAQGNIDFSSPSLTLNESSPVEQLEMFCHGIQSRIERLGDVQKPGGPIGQLADNGAPSRVGKSDQDIAELIHLHHITPFGVICRKVSWSIKRWPHLLQT